jgi:predicted dinucleotide-binding enzyme
MNIAIIGAGRIGGPLTRAWRTAGHAVTLGVRDTGKPEVQSLVAETGASGRSVEEAAQAGDVLVLAVPYAALDGLLPVIAPSAAGKIVIDSTNAFGPGRTLRFPPSTSAAEETAKRLPGARVIKAFNTQGAEVLSRPVYGDTRATAFYCGGDPDAKRVVGGLIADVGLEPVDIGPLENARLLEVMTLVWFAAVAVSGSRDVAFKLLRR